jgi:hypothetical protein
MVAPQVSRSVYVAPVSQRTAFPATCYLALLVKPFAHLLHVVPADGKCSVILHHGHKINHGDLTLPFFRSFFTITFMHWMS